MTCSRSERPRRRPSCVHWRARPITHRRGWAWSPRRRWEPPGSSRHAWIAVPRARLAMLTGNPKHALLFILEGQRRGRTERYGQLDLAVLRAAAELALGREDDATASLLRAVNQADKSGVIVAFH